MGGADDRVVAEPHVAVDDPFPAVFEDVAGHHVEHPRHVLEAGAEVEELGVLGEDAGLEVADLDRDLGDGEVLDLPHVLGVGVPEAVADHLVGDRVDLRLRLGRELQVRRHLDRAGRVEGVVDAVPELGRADRALGCGGLAGAADRSASSVAAMVIGRPPRRVRGGHRHDEVAGRSSFAAGAGRDDDPGDRQVDHRGPLDHLAERHRVAVVDGGIDGAGAALEVDGAGALGELLALGDVEPVEVLGAHRDRRLEPDRDDLDHGAGQQGDLAVALGVDLDELAFDLLQGGGVDLTGGEAHLELVALPLEAHAGEAAELEGVDVLALGERLAGLAVELVEGACTAPRSNGSIRTTEDSYW